MTAHALEARPPRRTWPRFTLREKRTRLVEERLGAVVAEARLLGISAADLSQVLRAMYEEEES